MRRMIWAALAAFVVSVGLMGSGAHAQGVTRICVPTYNGTTGALECHEGWAPALLNGLTTTVIQVKGSSGQLGTVYCYNSNATVAYIQFFDVATAAAVTLGTTKPVKSLGIPGTLASGTGPTAVGMAFINGLQVAVTTTATGNTAPGNAMDCNVDYN